MAQSTNNSDNNEIEINIENVQAVKKATLTIKKNKINIKFGYNGIGKSSMGMMIDYHINHLTDKEKELTPFSDESPKISFSSNSFENNGCLSFNKNFIDEWLFKKKESTIDKGYNVFFENSAIIENKNKLNGLLNEIKGFIENSSLKGFVSEVDKIKDTININDYRTKFYKGIKKGVDCSKNLLDSINDNFDKLIKDENSSSWFEWFEEGSKFLSKLNNENCPFCYQEFKESCNQIKDIIIKATSENDFKNNNLARSILSSLKSIIANKEYREELTKILKNEHTLSFEQKESLREIVNAINVEKEKIVFFMHLDVLSSLDDDYNNIEEKLKQNELNEKNFFQPGEYNNDAKMFNCILNKLTKNALELSKLIDKSKKDIQDIIKNSKNEINDFLKIAGIPYNFNIDIQNNEVLTTLNPTTYKDKILDNAKAKLSYGEINVLSLALFGAMAKRSNVNLIILDDPISSFDEGKKFAINYFLFDKEKGMLKDKTVLILTHDIEILIDLIKKNSKQQYKAALLLRKNNGEISEKSIKSGNIKNIMVSEYEKAKNKKIDTFLRLIHLRNYYMLNEIKDEKPEFEVLSSALHLREKPEYYNGDLLEDHIFEDGIKKIQNDINNFNYDTFIKENKINKLIEKYNKSSNDFEKLCLCRPILQNEQLAEEIKVSEVIQNFITKNYHIENLYIYSINGEKLIPHYIMNICNELIKEAENIINNNNKDK